MDTENRILKIVIDGLSAVAASPKNKHFINYNFRLTVDHVFDNEPIDWLPALVRDGTLSEDISTAIQSLYLEINEFTKNMSIKEEDTFLKNNNHPLPEWSSRAQAILATINQDTQLVKRA
jgi:hypothetical protein